MREALPYWKEAASRIINSNYDALVLHKIGVRNYSWMYQHWQRAMPMSR